MELAYKWVRPSGPSEEDQDAMLRRIGFTDLTTAAHNVWADYDKDRVRGGDRQPELTHAIKAVHQGDRLCVAFPQCFGHTEAEAKRRLADLTTNGGSLYVASLDITINLVPDMAPVLQFLAAWAAPVNKQRTEAARKERTAKQRADLLRKIRKVKPLWVNKEVTVTEIIRQTGYGRSTLYRWQREGLLPMARDLSR